MAQGEILRPKHIVLLGASVGKAWNITELPKRVKNIEYSFEYVGLFQFDKSLAVEQLLSRRQNRPNVVIIKECAAYFPSDITFETGKSLMTKWIRQCQDKAVVPIVTTVVPVTRSHDDQFKTHNPIKRVIKRILGMDMRTRMERIIEYNDWIKDYAQKEGLAILDLEAALRINSTDRFLRDDLANGDGLHLNREAYKLLDKTILPTLCKIKFQK